MRSARVKTRSARRFLQASTISRTEYKYPIRRLRKNCRAREDQSPTVLPGRLLGERARQQHRLDCLRERGIARLHRKSKRDCRQRQARSAKSKDGGDSCYRRHHHKIARDHKSLICDRRLPGGGEPSPSDQDRQQAVVIAEIDGWLQAVRYQVLYCQVGAAVAEGVVVKRHDIGEFQKIDCQDLDREQDEDQERSAHKRFACQMLLTRFSRSHSFRRFILPPAPITGTLAAQSILP